MTDIERLQQTLSNLIAIREQVTRTNSPTYTKDGQTVQRTEYLRELNAQIDSTRRQIDELSDDGIVEEHTSAWL